MTTKMIRFDESYADKLQLFINKNSDYIEIVDDQNLEFDSYFYERKAHLDKTIAAVEDGSMKMYEQDEWEVEMLELDKEIDSLNAS